jgi:hypothetical protein
MKGPRRTWTAIILGGALLTAATAFAGQPLDQVHAAVERSGVSREDRDALLQEAERALKAGVPAADLEVIVLRGRDRGLTAAMVRELIRTASRAGEQGLSVRPVLDRIEQGLAKGAPAELITAASQRLVEHLAAAGPLVDRVARSGLRTASPDDRTYAVETVARALERSVPGTLITDIGELALQHGWTMSQFDRSIRSLSLFVGAGVPVDAAGRVVRQTIGLQFTDRDYARLERRASDMLGRGNAMDEIVNAMEREIRGLRNPGERRDTGGRDRGAGADRERGGRGGRGR